MTMCVWPVTGFHHGISGEQRVLMSNTVALVQGHTFPVNCRTILGLCEKIQTSYSLRLESWEKHGSGATLQEQ